MVRRTDTAAIPNMCHWRYIATGPLGKPALAEKFDIPEDIVDSIKEKYAKMGKEKVEKQEKQDYSDLIKNIATINLLPTQDDYIHAVANITDLPEDYVKERFADLNITIAQDFLLDEIKLKLKESYLKRIERQSAKYIKTRIRKVKKKKKSGSRFFSRPIILGLVLLVFMSLSPLGFSQPRSDQQQSQFSGLNELGLQEKTERGIENLTIRHRNALYADLLNRSFVHIEDVLDYYPLQESLVRKGIRLEMPFELDDGLIYHGNYDLDKILLANQADGELFFTRIPYAWATGSFNETSKSPAIFVMDTKVFNDLANNGYAALDYEVFDLHGNRVRVLDPYPNASVFSIDQVKEIWVSEDTYGRYQRIISAEEASGLPIEDRPLMAIQDTLRHFLESGKIRRIPRLRHAQLSYSTPEERLATYAEVYRIVSNYMKKRDPFQHMPFFKLVGEESPFMNVNKKALIRRAWRLRSLRNAPLWILLGMAILSGPAILLWHRRSERKRRDAERLNRRLARQRLNVSVR